jgi:hypothetical protein
MNKAHQQHTAIAATVGAVRDGGDHSLNFNMAEIFAFCHSLIPKLNKANMAGGLFI